MPWIRAIALALAASIALCLPASASEGALHATADAQVQLRAMRLAQDPFADVHVVISQATYGRIRGFVRDPAARRDGMGGRVLIARTKAHRLADIARTIHAREHRCGGYFAFRTRAEAEAFVRADRSAQAVRAKALASYAIDSQPLVNAWLPQVREANLYATINHLQGYQNRYYASTTGVQSAEWIRNAWQSLAGQRSDVTTELFAACGNCGGQPSVILTIRGIELPDEIVVLGAHLDSINRDGAGNPAQRAPGADDDASGIAVLTETLRIALASGWRPQRTVKFMGYAAEEVGLRGSNAIAQAYRAGNANVVGVLQVDMTNYKAGAATDMRLMTDYSNNDLKAFFVILFDTYLAPLGITRGTVTCGYACSDHASWTSAGYPAAMMFEAGNANGQYPYIHTTLDTLQTMGESAQHSVKFAQFALAFLAETAKVRTMVTGGPSPAQPQG